MWSHSECPEDAALQFNSKSRAMFLAKTASSPVARVQLMLRVKFLWHVHELATLTRFTRGQLQLERATVDILALMSSLGDKLDCYGFRTLG